MSDRVVPAGAAAIARAADLLCAGELVAFPTETVYGLGGDARNVHAVRRIFAAKGRPAEHPVIVHLADASHLTRWARDVTPAARALAKAFWPGPLTLILPRASGVDDSITGGQDSVGLRVPSHPVARSLLREFVARGGDGVAAPSANRFGHVSPTTAGHVHADLGDEVALILDGGPSSVGIESTIVAFVRGRAIVLRPGGIAVGALTRVLGAPPQVTDSEAPRASGTLASHYATRTQAFLVPGDRLRAEIAQRVGRDESVAVLARAHERPRDFEGAWRNARVDAEGYAHDLYANLRDLDASHADAILIEAVPDDDEWLAVRDRLVRASHVDAVDERD
jgi:L-threonylcarbamoyladenylate synthase